MTMMRTTKTFKIKCPCERAVSRPFGPMQASLLAACVPPLPSRGEAPASLGLDHRYGVAAAISRAGGKPCLLQAAINADTAALLLKLLPPLYKQSLLIKLSGVN